MIPDLLKPCTACLIALAYLLCAPALAAEPPADAADVFARLPEYRDVKLSPNGQYFAVTTPLEDTTLIAVFDYDKRELLGTVGFGRRRHVSDFWWANDNRLLATPALQDGPLERPQRTGDLVSFSRTGKSIKYLLGQSSGEEQVGSNIKRQTAENISGYLIDRLRGNKHRVVVAVNDLVGPGLPSRPTRVALMDVRSGVRRGVGGAPQGESNRFLVDAEGEPRMTQYTDVGRLSSLAHYNTEPGGSWKPVRGLEDVGLLKLAADGQTAYVTATGSKGFDCLYALRLRDGKHALVYCADDGDLSFVYFSDADSTPLAAVSEAGEPVWHWLAPANAEALLLRGLVESLSPQHVKPVSMSDDGQRILLLARSPREPGSFYLFDRAAEKIDLLVARRSWIDPAVMSVAEPFSFRADDGVTVHGYITLPPGQSGQPGDALPAVVMPHGGPFNVRDTWSWDMEAQYLASLGFAVIHVNFRGSAGYGAKFVQQGKRRWGTRMIDDITQAVDALAKKRRIDRKRLCIAGGSYGAYAALMSAVREPSLYRCVVGYAGVYDLDLLRKNTDFVKRASGREYFANSIARDEEERRRQSPVTYLDALKAPMLIVHGGADRRTPVDQASSLTARLKKRAHPHEVYIEPTEGHGFFNQAHRAEYLRRMGAFVDAHIGE